MFSAANFTPHEFRIFWSFSENINFSQKRCLRKLAFLFEFYSKFALFSHFFFKKTTFSKKPAFLGVLEMLLFQPHSAVHLLFFAGEKISKAEIEGLSIFVQLTRKRKKRTHWMRDFPPLLIYGGD